MFKKSKERAVIHGYYSVKMGSDYSEQELDDLILEYGASRIIEIIKRICIKRRGLLTPERIQESISELAKR